jgi:hypothetical protein
VKAASFVLAIFGFAAGMVAAWYWLRSTRVQATPPWAQFGGIERPGGDPEGWIVGLLQAAKESAALNKVAAIWTAASVIFNSLAALAGAWQ